VIVALTRAGRVGRVDQAPAVFDGMPERPVATWSTMVSACACASRCGEDLALFSAMQPNASVLVSVLGCCASLGALDQGAWVHTYIDRTAMASP
jgi:hypothetical protein